jgi:homoserine kinase
MLTTVRVPASSANLGPGFDSLGLALSVYLTCRFQRASGLKIRVSGRDASCIPTTADNLIWQTALEVARGLQETLPPIELEIDNDIPLGKGLGSSAAALTAGVVIADQLLGLNWKPARVLDEAARIEGHPDNVAACVLGSIVASAIDASGMARAVRIELPESYRVAVIVPDFMLPTSKARAVLPDSYSRADAIFNIQRSALLIAALATGSTSAFPTAFEDRMHQPYRAKLVPGLDELLKLRAPGLLGCALSGAGPSILALYESGHENVCQLICSILAMHGTRAEVMDVGIAREGLTVVTAPLNSALIAPNLNV